MNNYIVILDLYVHMMESNRVQLTLLIILIVFFNSCTNENVCKRVLYNQIILNVTQRTVDKGFTDYKITRIITIEYKGKTITLELGNTHHPDFFIRKRQMLEGSRMINTLWFYNPDNGGIRSINLTEMQFLSDSLLSKGRIDWCSCSNKSCTSNNDCILITGCSYE